MHNKQMEIREIDDRELSQLIALYSHLHEEDAPLPDKEEVKNVWTKIQRNDNFKCYGGFIDNVLISSCCLVVIENLTRGCRPYAIIENVVTHAEYRRSGYGQQMLKYSLDIAWEKSCYKVMLLTSRLNEDTFKFYESVGFNRHSKQAFIAKP